MATNKQKKLLKVMANYGDYIPTKKTMLEAGYSKASAKNPKQAIMQSKSWNELLEKDLPEKLLTKRHKQLLNMKQVKNEFRPETGEWIAIKTNQPDSFAVSKGLDMAYKLRGNYAPEKRQNENLNYNITDEQLERIIDRRIKRLSDKDKA